jgi:TPR repeat protein
MKNAILRFAMALLMLCSVGAQAQGEESDNAFYNGVTAYRANNFEEAAQWFLQAAEAGDSDAQFLLGRMHYDGNSLIIDDVTAYMWFDIAAGNGLRAGARYRDGIAQRMSDEEIASAKARADQWRITHAPSQR